MVARNAVEGLRALARHPHGSYQVLLWRADHFLEDRFKDGKFDAVAAEMEAGGAEKIDEWGVEPQWEIRTVRYRVGKSVIKSHDGTSHDLVVAIQYYRKSDFTRVYPLIIVAFGFGFAKAAAKCDYPQGTVLDRVFTIDHLANKVKVTPRLDSIEIRVGVLGYPSNQNFGYGFILDVNLSDPKGKGPLVTQKMTYMCCSDLEPLDGIYRGPEERAAIHLACDTLNAGAAMGEEHMKGASGIFGYLGGNESPRP